MWPMAKAMVSTVRPKASETPASPIPTSGNAAAKMALPQPAKTSQKVPMNSAMYFFMWVVGMVSLFVFLVSARTDYFRVKVRL